MALVNCEQLVIERDAADDVLGAAMDELLQRDSR